MDERHVMLQGYLLKFKSEPGTLNRFLNGASNKRFFRVQAIQGGADDVEKELTLCYFKSDFSKEVRACCLS